MQQTLVAVIVVDWVMQHAAVIPKRDLPLAPVKPAGEFGLHLVGKQIVQKRGALLLTPPDEMSGVRRVHGFATDSLVSMGVCAQASMPRTLCKSLDSCDSIGLDFEPCLFMNKFDVKTKFTSIADDPFSRNGCVKCSGIYSRP